MSVLISEMEKEKIKVFVHIATRQSLQDRPLEVKEITLERKVTLHENLRRSAEYLLKDTILIYNGTVLEWTATPDGVYMEDEDTVLVLDSSFFADVEAKRIPEEHLSEISRSFARTRRSNVGNYPVRLDYFWAPMLINCLHGHQTEESKDLCRYQLQCIENILLKSFDKILGNPSENSVSTPGSSTLRLIKSRLKTGAYEHAYECIKDVYVFIRENIENPSHRYKLVFGRVLYHFLLALDEYGTSSTIYNYWEMNWDKPHYWNKKPDTHLARVVIYPVQTTKNIQQGTTLMWRMGDSLASETETV